MGSKKEAPKVGTFRASRVAGCRGLEPLSFGVTVSETALVGDGSDSQPLGNTRTGAASGPSVSQRSATVRTPLGIPVVSGFDARSAVVLSVREAATALKVATSTVYKLCAEGKLVHSRVSNAIRIPVTALARMLDNQE